MAWVETRAPDLHSNGAPSSSPYGLEDDATWTTRFFNGVSFSVTPMASEKTTFEYFLLAFCTVHRVLLVVCFQSFH